MTDRAIRDLERRSAHDPALCLELGRALERAGRGAELLDALWRGCADLEVRRAAAAVEPARHPVRDARLQWERRLDGRDGLMDLRASPLAITLGSRQRTAVLDPRTGQARADLPAGIVSPVAETLVVSQRGGALAGFDAWTGESLYSTKIPGRIGRVFGRELLLTSHRGQLVALRWRDPRQPPGEVWRRPWSTDGDLAGVECDDHLFIGSPATSGAAFWRVCVLDARTGEERASVDGMLASVGHGLLATTDLDGATHLHELATGRPLWSTPRGTRVIALTPGAVLVRSGDRLVVHDRASGAPTGDQAMDFNPTLTIADVHVVVPFVRGGLEGRLAGGARLWSWSAGAGRSIGEVSALPRRLYVRTGRDVMCLSDGPTEEPVPDATAPKPPLPGRRGR